MLTASLQANAQRNGEKTVTIRAATGEDVPALVGLGMHFLGTVYRSVIVPDPVALETLALHLLAGEASTILVAERDDDVIGMIGMLVYPHPMSGVRTAAEVMWFVREGARGSGMKLFRAAETWARAQGAQQLQMVAPNSAVGRVYQRLGFMPIEQLFQRSLLS